MANIREEINMNGGKIGLSEKEIIEILFNFIKKHFDDFEHRRPSRNKWWHHTKYGTSWAPFVEACFIIEGEKHGYGGVDGKIGKIGHSYSHKRITDVFSQMLKISEPYDFDHKYDDYLRIDISWRDENDKLILALEHSEDGSKADAQLIEIFGEIDKLEKISSVFKVIVSRPRLRRIPGCKDNYSDRIIEFKNKIKDKLSKINLHSEEKWIIILIAPEIDLKKADERTKIKFHSYKWENDKLKEIEGDYSFEVKMDNGGNVIKV